MCIRDRQTLDLVQTLYEKKLLTYPRTDSQFITDDMEDTARQVISIVCRQLPLFSGVSVTPDIARVTDNSKVTDHHAILPTVQLEKQEVSALPPVSYTHLTYAGKGNQGDFIDPKNPNGRNGQAVALNNKVEGCKAKDMIGIPWMLAFALRDTGWYLRNDIIWMKDNPCLLYTSRCV